MATNIATVGTTTIEATTDNERTNQAARTFSDMVQSHPDWTSDPLMAAFMPEYITGDRKNYYIGEGRIPVGDRYTRVDQKHPVQPVDMGQEPLTVIAQKWSRSISFSRSVDLVSSYRSYMQKLEALFAVSRRQRFSKFLRVLEAVPVNDANKNSVLQVIVDIDKGWSFDAATNKAVKDGAVSQPLNLTKLKRAFAALHSSGAVSEVEMCFPVTSWNNWQDIGNDVLVNHGDRSSSSSNYFSSHADIAGFNPLVDLGSAILYKNLASAEGPTVTSGDVNDWLVGQYAVTCVVPKNVPYINEHSAGGVDNMPGTILEIFERPDGDDIVLAVQCYEGFGVSYPNALARIVNKQSV